MPRFFVTHSNYTKKLWNLFLAQKVGFTIPNTLVSNDSRLLKGFLEKNEKVITKSIERDLNHFNEARYLGVFGTRLIDKSNLQPYRLDGTGYHSLLQNYIEKEYELRVFFLKEKIWAMAIFSQSNTQTQIDFRAYDAQVPNRMVPFILSDENQSKISEFMKLANLDTGSLDFVMTKEKKLVFLEVNPVGQYDFVSTNCNYYLHEEIAITLSNGK
ncbi:MAG: hypothetical protein NXI08_16675 [bacterium]|nr:hypothetical protein [bacterium]